MPSVCEILKTFDMEKWKAERAARRERLKGEYCARYGVEKLTDKEVGDLEQAEFRLKECATCNRSYCNKATDKFRRPQITVEGGHVKVATGFCEAKFENCNSCPFKRGCMKFGKSN